MPEDRSAFLPDKDSKHLQTPASQGSNDAPNLPPEPLEPPLTPQPELPVSLHSSELPGGNPETLLPTISQPAFPLHSPEISLSDASKDKDSLFSEDPLPTSLTSPAIAENEIESLARRLPSEHSAQEILRSTNNAETPLPATSAKITAPLPELEALALAKITAPLPELETTPRLLLDDPEEEQMSPEQLLLPAMPPAEITDAHGEADMPSEQSLPSPVPMTEATEVATEGEVGTFTEQASLPALPLAELNLADTIDLTPRSRRILLYLARRRSRLARLGIEPETAGEQLTPAQSATPEAHTPLPPVLRPVLPGSSHEVLTPIPPALDSDEPTSPPEVLTPAQSAILPVAPVQPGTSVRLPEMEPLTPRPAIPTQPRRNLHYFRPHSTLLSDEQAHKRKRIARLQYFSRKHLRRARASDHRESRRLWTSIWITTSSFSLLFIVIAGIIGYIAYNFISTTSGTYASKVLTLRELVPPDNLKIYDSQGILIDQLTDNGIHTSVKYDQIAPDLVNATVSIEDSSFWENVGVDITGLARSMIANLRSGEPVQGGSTITQQLLKQLIVGSSPDVIRKLSEIVLAPQVNNHYSKREIMEMYLNTIFYGHQAYGVEAAATVYFGLEAKGDKSAASQLDLAQSAMLAGLPRNASLYDPAIRPEIVYNRFQDVLDAMVLQGYISRVQAQDAYEEAQKPGFFKSSPTLQDQAPHFDDYILTQLMDMFHLKRAQLSRSGLIVYTTLNVTLQKKILKIMQQHIAAISKEHHVTNAAEVLIDFHTGAIISMLGSIDYNNKAIDGQYNAALGWRQPGSSFKPYVYVTAFEQGASPAQAVNDERTTFQNPGGTPPTYTPDNYDLRFHGHMTLRCALQNSLNVPAVRVLQHVGIDNAMEMAEAMGITYKGTPGLSLVLGGLDVRLLDHTSAIGTFANGGVHMPYYSISKVVLGTTGRVLIQHKANNGKRVITPQLAYMMTNVLSDNTSRTAEFFDCNVLQLYANSQQDCWNGNRGAVRPAAAKTGTTQDFRDNWTVGYTTDFVMGVWAGNDDNSPMINVTGVQGAAPIWHDAMLLAEKGHPIRNFQNPGGLVRATVTYPDGVKSTDWFLPGTVPHSATKPPTGSGSKSGGTASKPFCSTYSFAFTPPATKGIPSNGAWW